MNYGYWNLTQYPGILTQQITKCLPFAEAKVGKRHIDLFPPLLLTLLQGWPEPRQNNNCNTCADKSLTCKAGYNPETWQIVLAQGAEKFTTISPYTCNQNTRIVNEINNYLWPSPVLINNTAAPFSLCTILICIFFLVKWRRLWKYCSLGNNCLKFELFGK